MRSFHHAARPLADQALPADALNRARSVSGRVLPLAEKWDVEFAHYLGWLVGDGCVTQQAAVTVYGSQVEQQSMLPRHGAVLRRLTGQDRKPSVQANGTLQLRAMNRSLRELFAGLGVSQSRSPEKVVPESIFQAPDDIAAAFLRGLFDADGCVVNQVVKGTRYVGLGSRSEELLLGVQEMLASMGIAARIYRTGTKKESFRYTRRDGSTVTYGSDGPSFDLRISGRHIQRFATIVGFDHASKAQKLADLLAAHSVYRVDESVGLVSRESRGFETTYNLTEPRNHSYIVSGIVVANCSEYLHLDNSSCNLASLNLMKFLSTDGTFDAQTFARAVEFVITAMDISICFADFPTQPIAETTRAFRQLGIGYANLGALLMATGHAYDSEGGRALAAAITSLMTGVAYRRSAELAGVVGPYDGYARNADAHKRIIRKHAAANDYVRSTGGNDAAVLKLATVRVAGHRGHRRAQRLPQRAGQRARADGCLTGDTLVIHRPRPAAPVRAGRRVRRQVAGPRHRGVHG